MPKPGNFVANTSASLVVFALNILVSFWFTPYLVNNVGIDAYGYIPLALNLVNYASLLNIVFNSMTVRFLTIHLRRNNVDTANECFNTSLFLSLALVALLLPVLGVALLYAPSLLNVPSSLKPSFKLLFLLSGFNFFLAVIRTPFSAATFYVNRLDIDSGILASELLVRVAVTVLLFHVLPPSLSTVGVAYTVSSLTAFLLVIIASRRFMSQVSINLRLFSTRTVKDLMGSGSWNALIHAGDLLLEKTDLIIVTPLFGPTIAGKYALTLVWPNLIRAFSVRIVSVFAPTVTALYATGEREALAKYVKQAIRLVGALIGLPLGILLGFGDKILALWAGPQYESNYLLLIILTAQLMIGLPTTPVNAVFKATNRVRFPGLVTCGVGVLNLATALLLSRTSLGFYGVAVAGCTTQLLKNLLFTPVYGARVIGQKWYVLYSAIRGSVLSTAIALAISLLIKNTLYQHSWPGLIVATGTSAILSSLVIYALAIGSEDKKKIEWYLQNRVLEKLKSAHAHFGGK